MGVASVLLGEYLAGSIVVLMLAGGNALEQLAVGRAASALRALAKRVPTMAHRKSEGRIVAISKANLLGEDANDVWRRRVGA